MTTKFIRTSILCALTGAILFFPVSGCKKREAGQAPPKTAVAIVGDLSVVHASPKGPSAAAHESEKIVVIFDHPMVPLQEVPEGSGSSFLKLSPSVPGKFRWMGTRTLTFIPAERFPFGTEVKATIPAGTASLDGYSLKQDETWTFNTLTPDLVQNYPSDEQRWVRLDESVLLVFNQKVTPSAAEAFVSLTEISPEDKQASLGFGLGRISAKELEAKKITAAPESVLVLKPKARLRPDFTYLVELRPGLPGEEGPLGMTEARSFSFETFKSFRFAGGPPEERMRPNESLKIQFTNQVSYKDFASKVRFEPAVSIPEYYQEWDSTNDLIWLNVPLQPETEYTMTIPRDLADEFGNTLGQDVALKFVTGSYAPQVWMTTGHGVIEAYGNVLYSVSVINRDSALLRGAEVRKDEVVPLLGANKIFWSSQNFLPYKGFYRVEKPLQFKGTRNKRHIVPLDLREVLTGDHGLVFLQLDTRSEDEWDRYPKAFLQVTELGLSGKFSSDNSIVWVTELRTGIPAADVEVEMRDRSNRVCWRGRTDKDGKAQSPGWRALGIRSQESWEKPEVWVFATRGDDIAFMSSNWGTGIDAYRFGISYDWEQEPERTRGYLFTERGIYRAGETVHVKGIVRRQVKGRWQLPAVEKVDCAVNDPFQEKVLERPVELDEFGGFAFDIEISDEASLGLYQIQAKVPPDGAADSPETLYESFRVEAFRPAEFEVHLRSLQDSFVFGQDFQAEVRANYLFGGAMAGQKARWTLRLNPTTFAPPGLQGYTFGNELDWEEDITGGRFAHDTSRLVGSGEAALSTAGMLQVRAPLVPEKEKDTVMATLEATVQSPSRRSVSSRIQTVVHRGEFYVGLKPDTSFLRKGQKLGVSVVAALPDGTLTEKKVEVKLVKREWRSVRKAAVDGGFEWITEKEDTVLATQRASTGRSAVTVSFTPEKSGFYFLLAEATDGRRNTITSSTYFYVTGDDYVAWERRDDDTVELVPDRDSYKPGDKARILVKSPYEKAKALVTIEREFILESRVLEVRGSTSQIEVPILPDHIPNVFVSVLLVQGRTEGVKPGEKADVGKPSFKIGYIPLNVDPGDRRLRVDVRPEQERYKPRDQVTVRLRVQDAKASGVRSSVALAVVDVGVLNLIGYTTPNPFAHFFGPKPLSVVTAESRLNLVGQRAYGEKGEDVGGGGEGAEGPGLSLAEVELRGLFKTTPYWNPAVLTDDKGEARVTFQLPDNLTTFRIMAVALTQDSKFGNSEATFRVAKPLQLLSALPRFARVGDLFQGGVVIHNFSSQKGSVTLAGEFQGITPLEKTRQREVQLEPGSSKEILYAFKAERTGQAVFAFRAKMGQETDGLEVKLPIILPRTLETVALAGETAQSVEEQVLIPDSVEAPESKFEVQASATALSGLKASLDYLTDYPYLCLEQRLSSILPYILAADVIQQFKLSAWSRDEIRKFVQASLDRFSDYQFESGGFGLWEDSHRESPYLTCYAVFAMAKAREAGYNVYEGSLDSAVGFLKSLLRLKDPSKRYPYSVRGWATTLAFALYDLALVGQPEPGYASRLFGERNNLNMPLFGRTLLLKAIHLGPGAPQDRAALIQELLNKVKVATSQSHFEDEDRADMWTYSSNLRTTAYILQSLLEVGADNPLLSDVARWIVSKQKAGRWASTQECLYAFYALNEYFKKRERVAPDFAVEMSLAKKPLLKERFRGRATDVLTASTALADLKPGQKVPLAITKKGEGTLYYGARMTYVARKPLDPRDEGLAVTKSIATLDGKPLESVKAGTMAAVTLEIAVPQESLFVVVEDPLPAGFEAVNLTLQTESQEALTMLGDMAEEDEEAWWVEGFNHVEMHDQKVLLFADSLTPGVHTYRYLVRALTFGDFVMPGTKVEQMYAPEIFGRSAERVVKIIK